MKKYIITIGILFVGLSVQAQFYLKGYTGYSLSAGDKQISNYLMINDRMDGFSQDMKFGQGLNLGLSAGYSFNKNIAIEMTGNTQLLSELNFSPKYDYSLLEGEISRILTAGCLEEKNINHIFKFAPQLVFSSNSYNHWTFYLKGGPDFLYAKSIVSQNTFGSEYIKQEISGGINIGTQFSTGTEYALKENLRLFAEITAVNVRYNFNQCKILRYEIGGVDAMANFDTNFSKEASKMNFNTFGLNIGIKYVFSRSVPRRVN